MFPVSVIFPKEVSEILPCPATLLLLLTLISFVVITPALTVKFDKALVAPTAPLKVTVPEPALTATEEFARLVSLIYCAIPY